LDERLREKDLKGHIKPAKEDGTQFDESKAEGIKETDDLARDNQLRTAVDIIKSWQIMKKKLIN